MKVGRNVPCPCGSGVKYKKCCYKLADLKDEPTPAPPKSKVGGRKAARTALMVAQMLGMKG